METDHNVSTDAQGQEVAIILASEDKEIEQTVIASTSNDDAVTVVSSESRKAVVKKKGRRKNPFQSFPDWLRFVDAQNTVYYSNNKTGESRWLAPCGLCGADATKFCMDCLVSFCDDDYVKYHTAENHRKRLEHQCTEKEPATQLMRGKEVLKENERYCIECLTRRATKLCKDCWVR